MNTKVGPSGDRGGYLPADQSDQTDRRIAAVTNGAQGQLRASDPSDGIECAGSDREGPVFDAGIHGARIPHQILTFAGLFWA